MKKAVNSLVQKLFCAVGVFCKITHELGYFYGLKLGYGCFD